MKEKLESVKLASSNEEEVMSLNQKIYELNKELSDKNEQLKEQARQVSEMISERSQQGNNDRFELMVANNQLMKRVEQLTKEVNSEAGNRQMLLNRNTKLERERDIILKRCDPDLYREIQQRLEQSSDFESSYSLNEVKQKAEEPEYAVPNNPKEQDSKYSSFLSFPDKNNSVFDPFQSNEEEYGFKSSGLNPFEEGTPQNECKDREAQGSNSENEESGKDDAKFHSVINDPYLFDSLNDFQPIDNRTEEDKDRRNVSKTTDLWKKEGSYFQMNSEVKLETLPQKIIENTVIRKDSRPTQLIIEKVRNTRLTERTQEVLCGSPLIDKQKHLEPKQAQKTIDQTKPTDTKFDKFGSVWIGTPPTAEQNSMNEGKTLEFTVVEGKNKSSFGQRVERQSQLSSKINKTKSKFMSSNQVALKSTSGE